MGYKRIIRNYVIEDEQKKSQPKAGAPKIIKSTRVDEKETREIKSQEAVASDQPKIDLQKDEHGILTAIGVTCACGRTFTIKLEYE